MRDTQKRRWPFQPRPLADVIGLVRCSYIIQLKGVVIQFSFAAKKHVFYILSVVNQNGLPSTMCSTDLTQELRSSLQSYALCRLLWTPPWWGRCERWAAVGPSSVVGVRQNNGNLKSISSTFKGYFSGRFEFRWGSSFGEVRVYSISTRHFDPSLTDFGSWLVAWGEPPMQRTFVACDMSKVLVQTSSSSSSSSYWSKK